MDLPLQVDLSGKVLVDLTRQFHYGILTAEQVAQEMHNRVVLILLEMD